MCVCGKCNFCSFLFVFNKILIQFLFYILKSNRTCPICRGNASDYFESSSSNEQQQQTQQSQQQPATTPTTQQPQTQQQQQTQVTQAH